MGRQSTPNKPFITVHVPPMIQDLNQANEATQPALCDSCAGIQRNWCGAPGHAELMQGPNRKEARNHGQVTITQYRCERCGTVWEYENNKVNVRAGWSVAGDVKSQ